MGADRDIKSAGAVAPDGKYYCSHRSQWKVYNNTGLDVNYDWTSRGRCTQQRFLYLTISLREKYPSARFYMVVDDDSWVNPTAIQTLLSGADESKPVLMGVA